MKREDFIAKSLGMAEVLRRHDSGTRCAVWVTAWIGIALYFTMNPKLSKVVIETFVTSLRRRPHLPRQAPGQLGSEAPEPPFPTLKLKAKKLTVILWEIRYPGADGSEGVIVATTRPETLFRRPGRRGSIPKTSATRALVGKDARSCRSPAATIPVIADELRGPRVRLGLREDHARPRLQRL